jgi:hypothetical protein
MSRCSATIQCDRTAGHDGNHESSFHDCAWRDDGPMTREPPLLAESIEQRVRDAASLIYNEGYAAAIAHALLALIPLDAPDVVAWGDVDADRAWDMALERAQDALKQLATEKAAQ